MVSISQMCIYIFAYAELGRV